MRRCVSFQLLAKQPESTYTRTLKRHAKSDEYANLSIDPTRGFLLSLYLDKANWFERIAQGKSIGFVIIFVGLLGLAFSIFKICLLYTSPSPRDGLLSRMPSSA